MLPGVSCYPCETLQYLIESPQVHGNNDPKPISTIVQTAETNYSTLLAESSLMLVIQYRPFV